MSETPTDPETITDQHRQPPQPPAPDPNPSRSGIGRLLWRISMVLLGGLLVCSGVVSAAMLWVIFGSPLEPPHSNPGASSIQAEAKIEPPPGNDTVNAAQPPRPNIGPAAEATIQPSPPPAGAVEPEKPVEAAKAETPTGPSQSQPAQTQPQDRGPEIGRQAAPVTGQPATLAASRPPTPCSADLCAATYKSFHAADCTYQPFGGGPRSICELGPQQAGARPQLSRVATNPGPEPSDTQQAPAAQTIAAKSLSDRAGPQCNRDLCAATYKSFDAADCTYQPYGSGRRSICELGGGSARQAEHAVPVSKDSISGPEKMQAAGAAPEDVEAAISDRAGPQCNVARCAATYRSFHASDCTYQPEDGGPRRICEP